MPATTGTYRNNETIIYNKLISAGLNTAAACGILANLQAEAGFNPKNLQDSYEGKFTINGQLLGDSLYTKYVDSGDYSRSKFVNDSAGYGICQWTYSTRKEALYTYARNVKKTSIGDLNMQIDFLLAEIRGTTTYKDFGDLWGELLRTPNTATGAYNSARIFCQEFENPADPLAHRYRSSIAQGTYWNYYGKNPVDSNSSTNVTNIGKKIVEIARKNKDKPYAKGGKGPDTFDSVGLIHYCYNQAGFELSEMDAKSFYEFCNASGRKVKLESIANGDILIYNSSSELSFAIANGSGGRISAPSEAKKVVEYSNIIIRGESPTLIVRLLAESQISGPSEEDSEESLPPADEGFEYVDPNYYASLTSIDPYSASMSANLAKISTPKVDYDYGYLIDMTYGGEFKFYIPEFTENAGANWSDIEIRGRSVSIKAYESTKSRSINISLDLYAGVGLYKAQSGESGEDTISRMHQDTFFVKSLEYPDYTTAITRPPATVHLVLGSAVNISGVVSDVSVEHLKPLDSQNRSMYLKLSFTVTQTAVNPPDYRDIRKGEYALLDTSNVNTIYR